MSERQRAWPERPAAKQQERKAPSPSDVTVLGVGMHPWGKWGRSFVSYGVHAARAALADAGIDWSDVDLVVGGETVRNGYAGYVAGATFAQALGWSGARVATSYAACATGAQALDTARARILAGLSDVALVVGADTTPKGFLAPNAGERYDDPDWLRFRLLGMTNPAYFALYARRRMEIHGATPEDFAAVKVKNARHGRGNPNARYRKTVTAEEVLASPVVADPLHLLDICATSDGGAAVVLASPSAAWRLSGSSSPVRLRAVSTVTPTFPNTVIEMPNFATDSATAVAPPERGFRDSVAHAAYEEAGLGPEDMSLAEVYDLSTALELDWYENIGLCKPGEAERLVRDGETTVGGRIPVNPSGGLACFGEAVPAQALAQVCEVYWQLRGQAEGRQVEGARAGITANQGLFGHGSSVILSV
jgi:acetyl-CoA acetyltransferase